MARRAVVLLGAVMSCSLLSPSAQSRNPDADSMLSVPRFVEETDASGLVHRYLGEREFMVGGGVASLDCDGNGLTDLYLAGGTAPAKLLRGLGDCRFERANEAWGFDGGAR